MRKSCPWPQSGGARRASKHRGLFRTRNGSRPEGGFQVELGLSAKSIPAWGGSKDGTRNWRGCWRYTITSETKKAGSRPNIYEQPSQNSSCNLFHLSRHSVPPRFDDE